MADKDKIFIYEDGRQKVLKDADRLVLKSALAFEGSTDDGYETELAFTDPTADRTITFPNATGNVLIDSQDITLADDVKIKLGTGNDFEIFHDGTNSILKDTADSGGSTIKYLAGTQTFQNKDANKTMAVFNANGSIDLHHNGNKKLETTSSGVQTTGTVNINGAYTLPTSDGTANQVLATNGSGSVTFQDASGGGTALSIFNYGRTAALTNYTGGAVNAYTVDGALNGQGYTMPFAGYIRTITIAFDCTSYSSTASVYAHIPGYLFVGANVSVGATGDFNAVWTNTSTSSPYSFSAGDTLNVNIRHSATGLTTANHAITLGVVFSGV